MFKMDKKKYDISLGKVSVGTYKALLHPTSHKMANSLPIIIEVQD